MTQRASKPSCSRLGQKPTKSNLSLKAVRREPGELESRKDMLLPSIRHANFATQRRRALNLHPRGRRSPKPFEGPVKCPFETMQQVANEIPYLCKLHRNCESLRLTIHW